MRKQKPAKKLAKKPVKGSIRVVKCPMPPRDPPLPTTTHIQSLHYYEDERGRIDNFLARPLGSFAVISSKKGTIRAEHYHLKDWHYCWVSKGEILYFERPVGSDELPKVTTVTEGQMFFTPPGVEHSMLFMEDTVFTCMGKLTRKQEDYENDLVRLKQRLTDLPIVHTYLGAPPLPVEPITKPGATTQPETTPEHEAASAQDMPGSIA